MARVAQPRFASDDPVEILVEVARLIREEPRRYNQADWGSLCDPDEEAQFGWYDGPACGTVCCVAGWVSVIKRPAGVAEVDSFADAMWVAAHALRLTRDQASALFAGNAADFDDDGNYSETEEGTEQHARQGVWHIERFIRRHFGYSGPALWGEE